MPPYRILTFNWHEAYICMLASTGHVFDVVERDKAGLWFWLYTTRRVPENVSLVHAEDAKRRLATDAYDLVICHNLTDLSEVAAYDVPAILLFHNYRQTELALSQAQGVRHPAENPSQFERLAARASPVFISSGKRESWNIEGLVIVPGVDLDQFRDYQGKSPRALRVGNFLIERDIMMGGVLQQEVLRGIPHTTLGLNHSIRDSGLSPSFEALRDAYRTHRVYLHTTREGYEDGYNLALLEAMGSGMPVVSLSHSGSPVEQGQNGWLGENGAELRSRLLSLFEDEEGARRFGKRSREIVADKFPMTSFTAKWNEVFEREARPRRRTFRRAWRGLPSKGAPSNVLLLFSAYPTATARYLERAFRRRHRVVTAGPMITPAIIERWQLQNMKEPPRPQNISVPSEATLAEVWQQLPPGFEPDLVLWVEPGLGFFPPDIGEAPVPTACYLIDTHLRTEWHSRWAAQFDLVFLAQKACEAEFRDEGCHTRWLPLACDPEIHRPGSGPQDFEIGLVGSMVDPRRVALVAKLQAKSHTFLDRLFLEEMAEAFSRAKIVCNSAPAGDVNMRVFESLATGSFLLTEEVSGSGLEELFRDGDHLALYNEESLLDKVQYYLERPDSRRRIARRGRIEVLRKHTYDHRVEAILSEVVAVGNDRRAARQSSGSSSAVLTIP